MKGPKIGLVISIDKGGREEESAGIILNKKEMKTYAFFFDSKKEDYKAGDKVRYKLYRKTGVAYEVVKVKNGS